MPDWIKWTDRTFNFDFPTGIYPQIMERLRGTAARVEDLVAYVPGRALSIRAGESWSIKEHIGHLIDVERLFVERLDDYDTGVVTLRPADLTNRRTHDAHYNDQAIDSICRELRRVRAATVRRLEELTATEFERTAHHPRLRVSMRVVDLMYFHAEHDDHHLARVTRLAHVPPVASAVIKSDGQRTAMVCDDKKYMRDVIERVLNQVGVTVVAEAQNGVEAVAKYKAFSPDLVTMDMLMPDMTGLDAVREILKFDPAASILMCSALGQEALVAEAIEAGAKGYVLKPFTLSDLMDAVHLVL